MSDFFNEQDEPIEEGQEAYVDPYAEGPAEETDSNQHAHLHLEVVRRISRAKLYEQLLTHQLFAEGSADASIVQEVEEEIKQFVVERIEILMGIAEPKQSNNSYFTDEQVLALRILADRTLGRVQQNASPVMNQPIQASSPGIQMVQVKPHPPAKGPSQSIKVKTGKPTRSPSKAPARTPSQNKSITGKDLGQAYNPKALPMPSAEQMNSHIAMQASNIMNKGQAMMGSDLNLGQIVGAVMKNNK